MARLLFLTGTPADVRGGSGTFVGISVLRKALQDLGHDVDLLAPPPGDGSGSLPERLMFDWRAASAARHASAGLDAIVAFDMDGVFLSRSSLSIPRIAAIKGTAAEEARYERGGARLRLGIEAFFERGHVRGAGRIVAPSEHAANRIAAEYGVPRGRIAVVPEPIDLARWARALKEAEASPATTEVASILCVAHLYPRKDVATLLEAVARLPVPAQLRVVGDGPERPALEARARLLGLGSRAAFLGHIPFERLAEEYRGATVFCLPSKQEAFGIVFLEAMAAGLPIVAARAGAVPELLGEGEGGGEPGRLVPPGDPESLAAALGSLLSDEALRGRLGAAGRRRVRAYDAPGVASRFLEAIGLPTPAGGPKP